MIAVEKADRFRSCNVCGSREVVHEFTFWGNNTNSGTQVALCKKCAEDLIKKIQVVFNLK